MAKKRYNYIKKKFSSGSFPALGAFAAALLLLLLCLGISVYRGGEGPLLIGALGFSSLLSAVISLYYAVQGLQEKDRNRIMVSIFGGLSGVLTLFWIILIFVGIRLTR